MKSWSPVKLGRLVLTLQPLLLLTGVSVEILERMEWVCSWCRIGFQ
ncbi:hypothetical protein KC19_8G199400 [Ceratodon purpureus]|uniref:Uncharacterized protein n=1 Tax=Ceratodon purpureus TaxID=3225 RepID=A0A8T0H472_CERPU|nr:hypothetical protein KC19_8G199400 [Ceratodon purpureus]